jgi:predicted RNA-binding Zn ribbon-like protein
LSVTTLTGYAVRASLRALREPQDEIRDGFKFRGGHPALDLAATLAARRKSTPRELLATPADLGRWLVASGLATEIPPASATELEVARELREAIYRLAIARSKRRRLPEPDRALLNHWAAQPPPPLRLEQGGARQVVAGAGPLLALVARGAVDLLGGAAGERIRGCSGDGCSLLFVDTSRSGGRKWCSMAACGNRAKVARFRQGESA